MRGGTDNCQVVIGDQEIYSPLVEEADTLFAMNEPSYERFRPRLKPDGLLVINTSMAEPRSGDGNTVAVPATEMANELGDVRVANVVMLGAYNRRRQIVPDDLLFAEVSHAFGGLTGRLLELNQAAFAKGAQYAG